MIGLHKKYLTILPLLLITACVSKPPQIEYRTETVIEYYEIPEEYLEHCDRPDVDLKGKNNASLIEYLKEYDNAVARCNDKLDAIKLLVKSPK